MEINQTIKSVSVAGKAINDFLSLYAKVLVTYICGMYFLLFGVLVTIESAVTVSLQNKIIFFSIVLFLFTGSFIAHYKEIKQRKTINAVFLLGNSFGFLFSLIYFFGKIAQTYNYPFSFFEIEKYVFNTPGGKYGDMNMMETMYGLVGGLLFIMTMSAIVAYGLTLRDKYRQEGVSLLGFLPVLAIIIVSLGLFLVVIFYPSIIWYLVYTLTGSMLYIYGTNLFTKKTIFLVT